MAEPKKETLTKTLEEPIMESEANAAPAPQTSEETDTCEVGGDGAEDPREAKPPSIPSEENSAPPAAPATNLKKKARQAERFGLPIQLSEQEKRNSRAERFGVRSNTIGKIEAGNLEDEKRKARAERFGLTGQSLEDDKVKKSRV
ncbi:protein MODIFIER OF SNC1 11-like [Iris pallida]|uniref:Protein MODIFIER OF SNC1 11-like n=1 Tax=Iris pallida TaxID=29817 RepID=A0AAX6HGD1_IRIPA|nr:protein MODIFIER OF SNC1 11-like [Iris pallida]